MPPISTGSGKASSAADVWVNWAKMTETADKATAKLHKRFAYWPKLISGKIVWLSHYWIRYKVTPNMLYTADTTKHICEVIPADQYVMFALSGRIQNGEVTSEQI